MLAKGFCLSFNMRAHGVIQCRTVGQGRGSITGTAVCCSEHESLRPRLPACLFCVPPCRRTRRVATTSSRTTMTTQTTSKRAPLAAVDSRRSWQLPMASGV